MTRTSLKPRVFVLLMAVSGAASSAAAQSRAACASLTAFTIPWSGMVISKAEQIASGPAPAGRGPAPAVMLPAYCRVDGTLDERTGPDGKTYGIGFALTLPDTWNGRFLFQGGGGLNGSVQLPLGAAAASDKPALARGFAVVSTDTGHKGTGAFDGSFMRDQQAALDFEYAAVGRVALVAKQIVERYYARRPDRSYFAGCSTGGREAMLMAERYPGYFDGIVAGAPAMRTGYSGIGDRHVAISLNQIAPKDAAGKPIPGQALSDGDKKLVIDSLLNACDAKDGLKDGMIFNTKACDFDPAVLTCTGAKTDACLSPAQVAAIKKGFAGPKDSRGNQVYPGFAYDTGIAVSGQGIPGLLSPGPSPLGPPSLSLQQDVDREAAAVAADPRTALGDTKSWTNLNAFSSHGGKLIFYHGISDPWFSALDTIDYYEKVGEANGGAAAVSQWSRLFLVPGMGHCNGGPATVDSFDLLGAVVEWVERGIAPDSVVATRRPQADRKRPLCAYPKHAHYKGQGSVDEATNFECRE